MAPSWSPLHWSLTRLREKLTKIGAEVVRHSRYMFVVQRIHTEDEAMYLNGDTVGDRIDQAEESVGSAK